MKKIIYFVAIMLIFVLFCFACKFERTYKRKDCQIMTVKNNLITVKDSTNNFWDFKGKGFKVTDKVTLIMDTNNTDNNINDDIVINVIKE